jgi:lipid A 4'-phosphatase
MREALELFRAKWAASARVQKIQQGIETFRTKWAPARIRETREILKQSHTKWAPIAARKAHEAKSFLLEQRAQAARLLVKAEDVPSSPFPGAGRFYVSDPFSEAETRFRRSFLIKAIACGCAVGLVFSLAPGIDLFAAKTVTLCPGRTPSGFCGEGTWVQVLRRILLFVSIACSISVLVAACITCRVWRWPTLGIKQAQVVFVALALAAGPIVVANGLLKETWGRARPREVVEFGGKKIFTPPLTPSNQCSKNCSFVSGEASGMYSPFFVAALMFPGWRRELVKGGIVAGLLYGLIRMIQGGHFLSDILFAGVVMAISACVMHMLVVGIWRHPRAVKALRGASGRARGYARDLARALSRTLKSWQA